MKKTTLLDFFKVQNNATCPACGICLPKSTLNEHLDSSCSSSSNASISAFSAGTSAVPPLVSNAKSKFQRTVLKNKFSNKSRLSLKRQKQNLNEKVSSKTKFVLISEENTCDGSDNDVIFLEEIHSKPSGDGEVRADSVSNKSSDDISIDYKPSGDVEFKTDSVSNKTSDDISTEAENQILTREKYKVEVSLCQIKDSGYFEPDNMTTNTVQSLLSENNVNVDFRSTKSEAFMSGPAIFADILEDKETCHLNAQSVLDISLNGVLSESGQNPVPDKPDNFGIPITLPVSDIKKKNSPSESSIEFTHMNSSISASDIVAAIQDAEESLAVEDNVLSENSSQKENANKNGGVSYPPYYIANFKHILKTVLNEDNNKILFNDEDLNFVKAFESSSDAAQKFYVRLFQRKYKWLRINKINYPDISKDPFPSLEELVKIGLVDAGADVIEFSTALDLLSLPEAKNIAKHFKLNSVKSKAEIIQMLLKHCNEHKSVFFTSGNNISNTMLKKVKQVIGHCYRISLLPKRLFTRILMLFSLPTMSEDDEEAAGGQQQQLITLLQVNKGELVFPECKGVRKSVIFENRDDLIRYEEAKQLENDILKAVENKKFLLAKDFIIEAKEVFEQQCTCSFAERALEKPVFLKRYTSLHVYIRCLTQGVEVLQKLRQYDEAVELLKKLLAQKMFCQDYRGRLWDRLALNLEQHLKRPDEALEAIKEALKDKNVRVGYRYSLLTRAVRMTKSAGENDEFRKQILEEATVIEAPKVIKRGRLFPRNILGRRNVFISSVNAAEDEDDITVLGVEQLALEHYKNEGFTEGIHGEGSTFISLYGLLFWDIIYDGNIPDAFISPYQTHPLDLNCESFFCSRENQILNHLETIKNATIEELKEIVKSTWEAHFNKASLVAWDRFTDLNHVQGLISCLGNSLLSGICERLARDFRFTRSGVPDLVVWNPETLLVKIVEVKGPGDKLSSKQILWLDYLIKIGADAEVCLVEAVGSKKLRKE